MFYLKRVITLENYVGQAKNINILSNNNKYFWHMYQVKGTVLKGLHGLSGTSYCYLFFLIEIKLTYDTVRLRCTTFLIDAHKLQHDYHISIS